MKVKEALKILEKLNPDLGIFICLNVDLASFLSRRELKKNQSVVTVDTLIDCKNYIAIIPTTSLEITCPT